jgi:predicted metal-dependent hydrolase
MPPQPPVEYRPADRRWPALEIHRSARRRRTASAAPDGERIVVRLPAGLDPREEERLMRRVVDAVVGRSAAESLGGDDELRRRAERLADRFLDGVRPTSVRWSTRMRRLYGSCSPGRGDIRISARLATAPRYVLDAVLVHELAHLVHPDHSAAFHRLVARYPDADRARGWLEGFAAGQLAAGRDQPDVPEPPDDGSSPSSGP